MSRTLKTSIAMTAMLALLAGPALAQETAPATTTAPAATAPVTLPAELQSAGLTDVTSKPGHHGGTRIEGKLPDGTSIGALVDDKGKLRALRAGKDGVLPFALTDKLLPLSVRENAVFGEIESLFAVFTGERGIMVAGQDGEKKHLRAVFSPDGTLVRFDRGEHDRARPGRDWGPGKRGGERHDRRGPGGAGKAPQQQGALMPDQRKVRQALAGAGYDQIGGITREGARIVALAVNPEGEPVKLELNAQAQVTREINR
ncbi:hypothetical protein [Paracoccus sp. (in: a-proteobacteria)]|uniref:hypothetical protein n=1 Tax=Paracoccus sp. TaxID=267 RepID=UPI0032209371